MIKAKRHQMILRIIREKEVETQEELARFLRESGIEVTQATVSRDIKELRLVKIPSRDGHYQYALPHEPTVADVLKRAKRAFADYVREINYSHNIVFIKTLTGTAQAVAASIDELNWPEIVGTVAGDDGIIVICRDENYELDPNSPTGQLLERFRRLRSDESTEA